MLTVILLARRRFRQCPTPLLRSSTRQHEFRYYVDENGTEVDVRSIPGTNAVWMLSPHLYHVHDWGPGPTTWAGGHDDPLCGKMNYSHARRKRVIWPAIGVRSWP